MRPKIFSTMILGLSCISAFAQTPDAQLAFEVASVKISGPTSSRNFDGGPGHSNPTRYIANVATLRDLITQAYNVDDFQVSSKIPLDKEEYDIIANVPPGATKEQFRTMLQNFLAERFHLKLRIESKDLPAYALVLAKSGLKLKESVSSANTTSLNAEGPEMRSMNSRDPNGYILVRTNARQQPLSVLAEIARLWTPDGEPVIDQTGLTGKYDFSLEHTIELPGYPATGLPSAPSIFTALQQQLGLELIGKKLPFPFLTVEFVDRVPLEN